MMQTMIKYLALIFATILYLSPTHADTAQSAHYVEQANEIIRQVDLVLHESTDRVTQMDKLEELAKQADSLLNASYKEVMKTLNSNAPKHVEAFRNDQKAWLKFSERLINDAEDGFGDGGTMYINISITMRISMWVERIKYFDLINNAADLDLS